MKLNATHDKIIDFVSKNPNSEAKKIVAGTKLKADVVVPAIKKLVEAGILGRKEKGKKLSYSAHAVAAKEEPAVEEAAASEETKEEVAEMAETNDTAPAKEKAKSAGRDTTKFKFGGNEYGKGPLVLAVVKAFVRDKPKTTLPQLMKTFPPELLNRFGIVAEVKHAQKMSADRNRYFLKPEQVIKLKDGKSVAVCNQFTSETIKPFLKAAKELGYSIR